MFNKHWSTPYYGIEHLGQMKCGFHRVSVAACKGFAILYKWYPGCGFNPLEDTFYDEETKSGLECAKLAGEAYLNSVKSVIY